MVFNPSQKLVVDCYADADFAGLWGYKNTQDSICARIRNVSVVTFPIFLYYEFQNFGHKLLYSL